MLAHSFDDSVFCTALERGVFERQIPGAPASVLRNGVDLEYFSPVAQLSDARNLVFTGVMNYFPNVDGCRFFAESVLPLVHQRFPDARFVVVGSEPTAAVRRLADRRGVVVTGRVPDTRAFLREAAVCVAPLRMARGIQNKVLEGMAMALPVVGTTSSTQGVGGESGTHYLVADSAEDQAAAVCMLLDNRGRSVQLGQAARQFVEEHYHWEACMADLDVILEEAVARHRARRHGGEEGEP
jgi:glycosyltransferase involved in cell wall biosynthesis